MDGRSQLLQSAQELRKTADKERIAVAQLQKELDKIKQNVQSAHNHGMNAGPTENIMYRMERQVKDMHKDIDNYERQARDIDKQARSL